MLLIESAVNAARGSHDIFGRDLDFKNNLQVEIKLFVEQLNQDWNDAFHYFEPLMKLMYKAGKKEKLAWAGVNGVSGIVVGD